MPAAIHRSDVLPMLLSSRLNLRGALWNAVIDNASHASIAAASWLVIVALRFAGFSSGASRGNARLLYSWSCLSSKSNFKVRCVCVSFDEECFSQACIHFKSVAELYRCTVTCCDRLTAFSPTIGHHNVSSLSTTNPGGVRVLFLDIPHA